MAIVIKIEDILDINNNIKLNTNIFNLPKINKLIVRGIIDIGYNDYNNIIIEKIDINDMFNIRNILNTIEFYRNSNIYFTLQDVFYSNINDISIKGSFAEKTYINSDEIIYINMPFYNSNCYYIQSIGQENNDNSNYVVVNTFLTISSILHIYNTELFKILNLIKLISSSFFLYEYMNTEVILFNYINVKNLYFANIIEFINYMKVLNIHIENVSLYKQLYGMNTYDMFNYLISYFNISNLSFNLPDSIDILHHNFWHQHVMINDGEDIPNCKYYTIKKTNNDIKSCTYLQPILYNNKSTYSQFINTMLNTEKGLFQIINNNILSPWQHDNLQKIISKINFKNNQLFMNERKCYLTIVDNIIDYEYIYNIDNGTVKSILV